MIKFHRPIKSPPPEVIFLIARLLLQLGSLSASCFGGTNMSKSKLDIREWADELSRLRRRAGRLKRGRGSSPPAWQRWSDEMEQAAHVVEQMARSIAPDISSLAMKFGAILWMIEADESLLDEGDLRRLRRFGRDLERLASKDRRSV
jgi:hypothetical protein